MAKKSSKQNATAKKDQRGAQPSSDAPVESNLKYQTQRKYNVIVWGATGFTGALVCKHIAEHYHKVCSCVHIASLYVSFYVYLDLGCAFLGFHC
jgi:hypothetical protein